MKKCFIYKKPKESESDESEEEEISAGATSCVVLLTETKIICANAGDSRAVLCKGTEAVALSEDHKPANKVEKKRIVTAGHKVRDNRVDG